jgi:stress-induced morphogen
LEGLLTEAFPPPASIRLVEHDGIYGVITSDEFIGMDTIDRQLRIRELLKAHLSQEDRWKVHLIVGVTPDEGTGYLASVDR